MVKGLEAEGIGFGLAPLWSGHVLEDALRVEEQLLGLIELPEGRQRGAKQALRQSSSPNAWRRTWPIYLLARRPLT